MRTLLAALVLSSFCATPVISQGQSAIEMGQQHVLRSSVMDEDREILVTVPESYARTTIGYPVLFLLDGSSHILHATATTRTLAAARNRAPEMIVVAVPNTSGNRNRDLTPGAGAERFERFFGEELIPWVDSTYRTVPERIIMGHSLGGSFVTHALLNRPELFDVYIAASAPLWRYDSLAHDMRQGLQRAAKANVALYLTIGEEEWSQLRGGVERFAEALTATAADMVPNWSFVDLPGEDHSSTSQKTLYSSLETHYASYRFPYFEVQAELDSLGGLRAIEDHFARASSRFGYPVHPPERVLEAVASVYVVEGKHAETMELAVAYKTAYSAWAEALINRTGYDLLQRGDVEQAIAAFKRNTMLFSDSPNTYDSLADGYCRAGDEEAARKSMLQAVAAAEERSHPRVEIYRTRAGQPCR